jgi:hypothetical protein
VKAGQVKAGQASGWRRGHYNLWNKVMGFGHFNISSVTVTVTVTVTYTRTCTYTCMYVYIPYKGHRSTAQNDVWSTHCAQLWSSARQSRTQQDQVAQTTGRECSKPKRHLAHISRQYPPWSPCTRTRHFGREPGMILPGTVFGWLQSTKARWRSVICDVCMYVCKNACLSIHLLVYVCVCVCMCVLWRHDVYLRIC